MLVALRLAMGAKMVATMGLLVLSMVWLLVAIPVGRLLPASIPLLVSG